MREYSLQPSLKREVIGDFAFPLGLVPGKMAAPTTGYTLDYNTGEDDEPDTYTFHVVASHERLRGIFDRMLTLLPDQVHAIVEIGSRDAYRAVDVYMSPDPIAKEELRRGWLNFGDFLFEDGSVGAGANADDPFVEIFLDQWKGLSIHVPVSMRDEVEERLQGLDLEEVGETWPETDDEAVMVRPVLEIEDEFSAGVDEMMLQLRRAWGLELNVDPFTNVDDAGRALGPTLWHAMVIIEGADEPEQTGYASIWATARSLAEMDEMLERAQADAPQWRFTEVYTIDRVAYDERPDQLTDLGPAIKDSAILLVEFEA